MERENYSVKLTVETDVGADGVVLEVGAYTG